MDERVVAIATKIQGLHCMVWMVWMVGGRVLYM